MKAYLLLCGLTLAACQQTESRSFPLANPANPADAFSEENGSGGDESPAESSEGAASSITDNPETQATDSLANKALAILQRDCASCHNPANPQGNFGSVMQVNEMVASQRFIVAGEPDKSSIITRLAPAGNMPPGNTMAAADVSTLKSWISQMRKEEIKPLLESELISLIRADIEKNVLAADRPTTRYFTLHTANNRKAASEIMTALRQGFNKMLNSISRNPAIVLPQSIDGRNLVYRVNLASLNMPNFIFDGVMADFYPYTLNYVPVAGDAASAQLADNHNFIRQSLGVDRYLIRADWFVATAPLPTLYTRLLRLGADQNALDVQLGVNVFNNIFNNRVLRSGFKNSGVSTQNRVMERHTQRNGQSYWISYDFASNEGLANIFAVPLGPLGIGQDQRAFVHDGGEIIFQLPNGLFGYYLSNAAGVSIDKGPTAIVKQSDAPQQFISSIVNGVSCMTCHNQGLIYKKDEIRPFFMNNPGRISGAELNKVLALFPEEATFKAAMDRDNAIYIKALKETGVDPAKPDPISIGYRFYNQSLGPDDVAEELGLDAATFKRLISVEPYKTRWSSLSQAGGYIKREELNIVLRRAADQFKPNINPVAHRLGDMILTPVCMAADPLFTGNCLIELVRQEALAEQAAATNPPVQ